jgi:hypothetical protein
VKTAEGAVEYVAPQAPDTPHPFVSRVRAALSGRLHERAKVHRLVGHRWFLGCVGVLQPDPTGESPATIASRSLATAL